MHSHVDPAVFLQGISGFLCAFYVSLAVMNAIMAAKIWKSGQSQKLFEVFGVTFTNVHLWIVVTALFTMVAPIAWSGDPWAMKAISVPQGLRDQINQWMGPVVYNVGTLVVLAVMFQFRRFFVRPMVAWTMLNLALVTMGFSMTDQNFAAIVTKPDNVPIVGLVFLLGFFTWLATYKAVRNDERLKQGLGPLEAEDSDKVLVWPDLVYTELICMVALTALLLLWAIALQAPLEEPASAVKTPNPSKAPWYFLGLQEMLVYYDPWMAGVVLPSTVVFGLMAIPFIDFNKRGNGYYTIDQRPFAYLVFQFGFLVLWVTLIVMGTFMRGPNWNFFGPYEVWDPHKVEVLNNVDLSEFFWIDWLGRARPMPPAGAGFLVSLGYILMRESVGIILLVGYFSVLPIAMVMFGKFFRDLYVKMGFLRYMVFANLLLMMALLPLKMVLRWSVNLKYFIAIPEYLLNF
ncbi:MAG: hypothetical protein KDB14_16205 [Planctomycetales bacterium]|nr:hypothetical protein [Planctomycetales bacterium]